MTANELIEELQRLSPAQRELPLVVYIERWGIPNEDIDVRAQGSYVKLGVEERAVEEQYASR